MYTKAIYFKDGKFLTLTEQEASGLKERLLAGDRFVEVQGTFISADNVARIGSHETSSDMKRIMGNDLDRNLVLEGRGDLVDAKRLLQKKMSIERKIEEKEEVLSLPMSSKESENGDANYWVDEMGIKHYE